MIASKQITHCQEKKNTLTNTCKTFCIRGFKLFENCLNPLIQNGYSEKFKCLLTCETAFQFLLKIFILFMEKKKCCPTHLPGHYHADGLAQGFGGVQFVKTKNFAVHHPAAPLAQHTNASLVKRTFSCNTAIF